MTSGDLNNNRDNTNIYNLTYDVSTNKGSRCHVTRSRLLVGVMTLTGLALYSLAIPYSTVTSSEGDCCVSVHVRGHFHQMTLAGDGTVQSTESPSSPLSTQNLRSDPEQRLPQCLIIGARKSGTRALLEFLSLHPDIRIQKQELHFFDDDQIYSLGLDWYRRRMPYTAAESQLTVEKTPGYFVGPGVPERIRSMNASIKLLLIVREPVQRAISDYLQIHMARLKRGKYHARFEDLAIDPLTNEVDSSYRAVRRSIYCLDMARWLATFHVRQFHFVNGENLVRHPVEELRRVESFLGLEHRISESMFYFNDSRGFYCIKVPPTSATQPSTMAELPASVVSSVSQRDAHLLPAALDTVSEIMNKTTDSTLAADQHRVITNSPHRCLASSKGRAHPNISPWVVQKLRRFFRPHNEMFYQQTGINFGWPET